MHRRLLDALCAREHFDLNAVQHLKCLQALIRNTPYQKLPKLVTSLVQLMHRRASSSSSTQALNGNAVAPLSEIVLTFALLLASHHQLAELHLALLSPLVRPQHV